MPIIQPTTDIPDLLLAWPGPDGPVNRIQIERSATGAGAGYANIGSSTILPATETYTFYDPNGNIGDWYRWYPSNAANTFPISANREYSPELQWGAQVDVQPLLCSLVDVKQELGENPDAVGATDEAILDKIRQVSTAIEGYCGRWFVPRPLSGTTTYRTRAKAGRDIRIGKGIRSVTSIGIAYDDQPASGGTYTAATVSDIYIDPPDLERDVGWPGTWLRFRRNATGPVASTYDASYGVEIVGAFGWAAVPADIQGVAIRAVIRRHIGKAGGGVAVAVGPEGTEFLLPDMSGSDRTTLDWYRDRKAD